jgi:hypothetical protein
MSEQLRLDIDAAPDPLADLDYIGHERRLLELDGVDFSTPSAPRCVCVGGPLVFADDLGDRRCVHCGREVPP